MRRKICVNSGQMSNAPAERNVEPHLLRETAQSGVELSRAVVVHVIDLSCSFDFLPLSVAITFSTVSRLKYFIDLGDVLQLNRTGNVQQHNESVTLQHCLRWSAPFPP